MPLPMLGDDFETLTITAAEARDRLAELASERALALTTTLAGNSRYMNDLDDELELWRRRYVTAAVTEIATLLAELGQERRLMPHDG
ncbi:MAG TPA: hypothetical protein VK919_01910 [Solirubrobacterales bacterium]|nr:hypothetical protein [Solirubrobacterales bacterium]